MQILSITPLAIPDMKLLTYKRFADERGYFTETYRREQIWEALEIPASKQIEQVNESFSKKGVVRGLHLQHTPPMAKIVRVVQGSMIDLGLDLRSNSPTFGKISGVKLSSNPTQDDSSWIYIPEGFAHGVFFLEDTVIEYLCTAAYAPQGELGILPQDPELDWSLCDTEVAVQAKEILSQAIFSEKDKQNLTLASFRDGNYAIR